jgi:hypothetical protein
MRRSLYGISQKKKLVVHSTKALKDKKSVTQKKEKNNLYKEKTK